jgi:hypothetical protein
MYILIIAKFPHERFLYGMQISLKFQNFPEIQPYFVYKMGKLGKYDKLGYLEKMESPKNYCDYAVNTDNLTARG